MKTTELVAWVGATTGIASLIWNIYAKVTANRPKLVVKAYANMIQMPPPPRGNPRFLRVTVQNIGTAPTTLTNVEFFEAIPRWKLVLSKLRPKLRAGEIHAIMNDYRGPQIPLRLEVGSEWTALMEQEPSFEDWLKKDKLTVRYTIHSRRSPYPQKSFMGRSRQKSQVRVEP
jgi:hypothetical protein